MKRVLLGCSLLALLVGSSAFAMDGVTVRYQEVSGEPLPGFVVKNNTGSQLTIKGTVALPTNPQSKLSLEEYKTSATVAAGGSAFIALLDFKNQSGKSMDPSQIIWKKNQRPKEGCVFTFDLKAGGQEDTIWLSVKSLYP